jgi:hypothetical protein
MTVKQDAARRVKLRGILYQASREGWATEQLDEALVTLYGRSRAAKKPRQAAA